ncbi:MAG: membrane protein insertion efficiency factor YidD [Planctomycetes bacterium]|nr:membrane protein insertion efficiency factor YidD [Planctomycetota bacterium]
MTSMWPPPVPAPAISPWRRPLSCLAIWLVRVYQRTLSRLWPNICMYHPSCSTYMIHAITRKGLIRGLFIGGWRILRCHPFATGGYDPPPGYEDAIRDYEARGRTQAQDHEEAVRGTDQ